MRIPITYDELVEHVPEAFDFFLKKKDESTAKNALEPFTSFNFEIHYASVGRAFSFAEILAGANNEPVDNSLEGRFKRICGVNIQAQKRQLWWSFPIDKTHVFVERKLVEQLIADDELQKKRDAELDNKSEAELIEAFLKGGGTVVRL